MCHVKPNVPGVAPWGLPSLCQMTTAAARLFRQSCTVLVSEADPVGPAVKLFVVPWALPQGVNRFGPVTSRCTTNTLYEPLGTKPVNRLVRRSCPSRQLKDAVPAAFSQTPRVMPKGDLSAANRGVAAGEALRAGASPATWWTICGPVRAGEPGAALKTWGSMTVLRWASWEKKSMCSW